MKLLATPEPFHVPHLGQEVHLGKLEPRKDKRTLQFAKYVPRKAAALPPTPSRVRRSDAVPVWPMYGNDTLPDCTTATVGHMEELWSAVAGSPVVPSDADVLDMFRATGPMDEGRYELDILNYWHKVGFGREREKIIAFVQIDARNATHMQLAIYLFGAVFAGLALPKTAQVQSDPSKVWAVGRGASGAPGTWGGHAVPIVNYWRSRARYGAITWGYLQAMTFGFWGAYGDEAYCVIGPDWFNAQGDAPVAGFNLPKLMADLAALAA